MPAFNPDCVDCPRLASHLAHVRERYGTYYARPVPPFGDPQAKFLIVGLAPGMHGANRSGRPFTGDHAGILLYRTLHAHGFASRAESVSRIDGLELRNCRVTNAVKCLPPQNKPVPEEVRSCNRFLKSEFELLPTTSVILALGTIAHRAVIQAFGLRQSDYRFSHTAEFSLPNGHRLIDSYHCSRYNTQTGRLTPAMFDQVIRKAVSLLHVS